MPSTPLLDIAHVCKDFRGGVRANADISFQVRPGEVFGLLGHNGAGKTTLLNQVIGLLRPTSGSIRLDGADAVADPDMARRFCSFQPQSPTPAEGLTPRQAIEMMARIRGASRKEGRTRADELVAALDITEWADRKSDKLSGGVKRLAAFGMTVARPGHVVMFDEPTNDVDPVRRRLLWTQIRELADGGSAVLLVTHNVLEAERAVDRLAVLDKGAVLAQGTPTQLRGDQAGRLRVELVSIDPAVAAELASAFGGVVTGRRVLASIDAADCASAIARVQREQELGRIDEFAITPTSLEDVYVRLVGAEAPEGVNDEALVA
ncbi:MAG TPA: ABC transporter ATP-binding protein [Stackebrandtia sp.]|uniref:ABC transporter ATP-binding protein n=1 Tax=Stackebrandtia sp. TaxID=2023065 RepID=UPI002D477840|nr:ABC transporter ATP-binding protein [Stackebrandtia sp.]HZE39519.1 ABC transporter ATP-binding protein [Stackebrandtia sp.]